MNCYDCAHEGRVGDAVAVCVGCGAAVCLDHSHTTAVWLTRTEPILRVVQVEPSARAVRCGVCTAAYTAATSAQPAGARR
jgi:hypothetical protein